MINEEINTTQWSQQNIESFTVIYSRSMNSLLERSAKHRTERKFTIANIRQMFT